MTKSTLLRTIQIESQPSFLPSWSENHHPNNPKANRVAHFKIINPMVFKPEQQAFILEVTGGENPCTLMLDGQPYYAPDLHPAHITGWMRFLQDYADRKAALLKRKQDQRDFIDRLASLSDEDLLPHHEGLSEGLGRNLEENHQLKAQKLVQRFKRYVLKRAEGISAQNRQWVQEYGSPELQAAVEKLPEDVLLFDFAVHFWEAITLLMDDPRMADWWTLDTFLYEYVKKTYPGALFACGPLNPPKEVPEHLQEQARSMGGTLVEYSEDHEIPFPAHMASDEALFKQEQYAVQVPWGYRWLVYPLQQEVIQHG